MPTITSKNTSVNSTKVPAIYNKIDWKKLRDNFRQIKGYRPTFYIFDIGCGRNPNLIHDFLATELNKYETRWCYLPYDPYWLDDLTNERNLETWYGNNGSIGCVICSNVLNVLQDDKQVEKLHKMMHDGWKNYSVPYFITVYEGDGSGIGKKTKPDCYQRNLKTSEYAMLGEAIRYGVISPYFVKEFIKK